MSPSPRTGFRFLEEVLRDLILQAVRGEDLLPEGSSDLSFPLEIPKVRSHGDLASPMALQLASRVARSPLEIAQRLTRRLQGMLKDSSLREAIEKVEMKPPGFINFFFTPAFLYDLLREILRQGPRYGRSHVGAGKKALVEFVSANPTGPLSVAHGRQAAVGDALANVLSFTGHRVHREYYLNDEGTQIDLLGASILARAQESMGMASSFPENGYKGDYVVDLGKAFSHSHAAAIRRQDPRLQDLARRFGVKKLTRVIRGELTSFGVKFDRWFPQGSLSRLGYLRRTLDKLKAQGNLYESQGAWWLKSTAFGDDKDRVVIRSDGRLTYIAADIAYHRLKFERGFSLLVNLWGPDHHGYISRLKAAVQALGRNPAALRIRIVQLCTLRRGNDLIPMSTREGQFTTLTEVMKEVGADAARFFFLLRKSDAPLEFDLALAKQLSPENPVYYIQYAHARIWSILEYQKKQGDRNHRSKVRWELLAAPEELHLLRILRGFPGVVELSARSLEPFGVVSYLQELAEGFHRFYDVHRVVSPDAPLTQARLCLIEAVKNVLATGLKLLGVSAPRKM